MSRKTEGQTAKTSRERYEAVLYARVSSKEQEKESFSIPAQRKLLRRYAADHSISGQTTH